MVVVALVVVLLQPPARMTEGGTDSVGMAAWTAVASAGGVGATELSPRVLLT